MKEQDLMKLAWEPTFGRKVGCSSMTEELRNLDIRQSFPWMARGHVSGFDAGEIKGLTGIGNFGDLVRVEFVPDRGQYGAVSGKRPDTYQRWPARAMANGIIC